MKVTILLPYVRKKGAKRCAKAAIENAGINKKNYKTFILACEDTNRIGVAKMVSYLTKITNSQYIVFLGDDCIPHRNWLKNALNAMKNFSDGWGLIGLNDLTGRTLPCHWLADRRLLPYLDDEFFHTGYKHLYCDNELMDRCIEMKRFHYELTAVVEHDHPLLQGKSLKELKDPFYKEVYSEEISKHDSELYKKRKANKWKS